MRALLLGDLLRAARLSVPFQSPGRSKLIDRRQFLRRDHLRDVNMLVQENIRIPGLYRALSKTPRRTARRTVAGIYQEAICPAFRAASGSLSLARRSASVAAGRVDTTLLLEAKVSLLHPAACLRPRPQPGGRLLAGFGLFFAPQLELALVRHRRQQQCARASWTVRAKSCSSTAPSRSSAL